MSHQSTERVIGILKLLAENSAEGLSYTEIVKALAIPKGSLYPILSTLRENQFVYYRADGKKYYLGEALFVLGSSYTNNRGILDGIGEVLAKVSSEVKATSYLGVLSGGDLLYILRKDSPGTMQVIARSGYKFPAYSTALGKSLLFSLSLQELQELYPDSLMSITPKTITDLNALYTQLQEFKEKGFSYESEESSPYIRCVATPVTYKGKHIAAISVAFPTFVREGYDISRIETQLSRAREAIEGIIGREYDKWIYSEL